MAILTAVMLNLQITTLHTQLEMNTMCPCWNTGNLQQTSHLMMKHQKH